MKYLRFGIYILLIFFLFFPFLVLPRLIKVKKVECHSQYGLCSNELLIKVNSVLGDSIDGAKKKAAEVFKNTQLIENYSFRFKLPSTLRIDLILKKPKYALYSKETKEIVVVDGKGVVLEKATDTNLPHVTISDNLPNVGEVVDSKKIFALEIIHSIYYLYQVKSGEIINDSLEVIIPGSAKIIFPLGGERDILLGSIKLILSRLNQDENSLKIGKVKEIDLRYKNPVIRYE